MVSFLSSSFNGRISKISRKFYHEMATSPSGLFVVATASLGMLVLTNLRQIVSHKITLDGLDNI